MAFTSSLFDYFKWHVLREQVRFTGALADEFKEVLSMIRIGNINEKVKTFLRKIHERNSLNVTESLSTTLFSKRDDSVLYNQKNIDELEGPYFDFMAEDDFLLDEAEVSKVCNAHKSMGLKVGMRIMFIRNDFDNEISNGTIGII